MTIDFTPAQSRAARALLAWSQQDLAKAAQVATSTVADFERNARISASASVTAFRTAFEAEGISFLAGGAVEAGKLAPTIAFTGPGAPMRWIDSTHIVQWAERRSGGQESLPQMISDLILSAYGPAAQIRMPSGDSVQHAGLDGFSLTADKRGLVPAGTAAWEFGTQKKDKLDKAQGDYDKRTREPGAIDIKTSTFVFVTARRWPGKDAWAKSQAEKRQWADVRAYDADDLVHWLESTPDVGLRWAERIARRPKGLQQLADVFKEWSLATRQPLPADLLLVGRGKEAAETQGWLSAPPSVRPVQAEAAGEAMAFLYAAIAPYPEPYRQFRLTRCVVAETDGVARDLVGIGAKLVVVMNGGDAGLAQRLVEDGHHVFVAYGSEVGSPREVIRLPRLERHELERALIDADVPEDKAHALAAQAAGSLTVLRRLMPRAGGGTPDWALKPSKALIAALLVGAWCDDRPADREIVATMADMPYDDVVAELTPLAQAFDGPLRRSGEAWKLASLLDAWLLLAPNLTKADLDRHARLFQSVLSVEDPSFKDRLDGNWIYRVPRSENAPVSGYVRRGLTEAVTVMGAFADAAPQIVDLASHADRVVKALLGQASGRLWWSLQGDFQRLAEASPRFFLETLGAAIVREDHPLEALFQGAEGALSPREFHHGLLWALEILAWSPDYLGEVAQRLAELDALSRGERKTNRPLSTLQRIFLPWTPQTFADADTRHKVVKMILRRYPDVGWKLLRGLAPTGHGMAFNGPKPILRTFAPEHAEALTFPIVQNAHRWIGDELLGAVGEDLARWRELIDHWANFSDDWRAKAAQALGAVIDNASPGAPRDQLREKIRDLVGQHRAFADAQWAMPAADVDALERLMDRLEPTEPDVRHAWLFASGRGHRSPGLSWSEAKAQAEAAQARAVREIADQLGTEKLIAFALQVRQTYAVGEAIGRADLGDAVFGDILEATLASDHPNADSLSQMLLGWLANADATAVPARFDQSVRYQRPPRYLTRLALALPVGLESWVRIDVAGLEVSTDYWKTVSFYRVPKDVPLDPILDRLIAVGRIPSAVCLAGLRLDDGQAVSTERLIALLKAAISIDQQADIENDALDFRDRVVDIFKHLDGQPDAQSELFSLEWAWCGLLEHTDRPPRRLQTAMAESPDFFMTLMKLVYMPDADSGVTDEAPADADKVGAAIDQAYRLLDDFSVIPGRDEAGLIDGAALETWLRTVRAEAARYGRLAVTDIKIGRMLASAPRVEGEIWPPEAICEALEIVRSDDLDSGFELGVYNRRGVTVRMPGDGGVQERVLVKRYREDAKAVGVQWPRVRRILENIAEHYECDATRQDQSAERRDW